VCVCVCVRARARACARVCECVCMHTYIHTHTNTHAHAPPPEHCAPALTPVAPVPVGIGRGCCRAPAAARHAGPCCAGLGRTAARACGPHVLLQVRGGSVSPCHDCHDPQRRGVAGPLALLCWPQLHGRSRLRAPQSPASQGCHIICVIVGRPIVGRHTWLPAPATRRAPQPPGAGQGQRTRVLAPWLARTQASIPQTCPRHRKLGWPATTDLAIPHKELFGPDHKSLTAAMGLGQRVSWNALREGGGGCISVHTPAQCGQNQGASAARLGPASSADCGGAQHNAWRAQLSMAAKHLSQHGS